MDNTQVGFKVGEMVIDVIQDRIIEPDHWYNISYWGKWVNGEWIIDQLYVYDSDPTKKEREWDK